MSENDTYGSTIRRHMMAILEKPAKQKTVRYLPRYSFWAAHSETIGLTLWMVAILIGFALAWIGFSHAEGLLR